jgi:hypothetical protein
MNRIQYFGLNLEKFVVLDYSYDTKSVVIATRYKSLISVVNPFALYEFYET